MCTVHVSHHNAVVFCELPLHLELELGLTAVCTLRYIAAPTAVCTVQVSQHNAVVFGELPLHLELESEEQIIEQMMA